VQQFLIGISGALLGVIGWLLVGMYIQRRLHNRQARDAARAVFFELGANHLVIYTALEYGAFGPLGRTTFDRLLPELATWLPAPELQALCLAYLGHAGYEQIAREPDLPTDARRTALAALLETHRIAGELVRLRAFSAEEIASLGKYASAQDAELMQAAESAARPDRASPDGNR
jgi:DNA-directed RNA polymerase specialized sigma24 family protein